MPVSRPPTRQRIVRFDAAKTTPPNNAIEPAERDLSLVDGSRDSARRDVARASRRRAVPRRPDQRDSKPVAGGQREPSRKPAGSQQEANGCLFRVLQPAGESFVLMRQKRHHPTTPSSHPRGTSLSWAAREIQHEGRRRPSFSTPRRSAAPRPEGF